MECVLDCDSTIVPCQTATGWSSSSGDEFARTRFPDASGFELCSRLRDGEPGRRWNRDVPVIMVSSRGDPVDRVRGFARGCDDYIVKPFVYDELVARMRAVLRRSNVLFDAKATPGLAAAVGVAREGGSRSRLHGPCYRRDSGPSPDPGRRKSWTSTILRYVRRGANPPPSAFGIEVAEIRT
jgi:DNA-binding NarL/FixJ family response regulator